MITEVVHLAHSLREMTQTELAGQTRRYKGKTLRWAEALVVMMVVAEGHDAGVHVIGGALPLVFRSGRRGDLRGGGRSLGSGGEELEASEVFGELVAAEHVLGFLNEVPAAAYTEFGEQRRNVELDRAHGDAQAVGDFLVDAPIEQLFEDFAFAGTESNGAGEAAP